jgi:Transposase DDE domain
MRRRRETVEHPFGTLKMRMGATHFLMKTLPKVASEMALSVLAYNLTRVMNIVGTRALLAAIRAECGDPIARRARARPCPAFPTMTQRRRLVVQHQKIAQIGRVGLH